MRESLLTLAAALGLICILAVLASWLFGASFVVFRTGSMEPKFPVGALSLTVRVPADQLRSGDVVSLPVQGGKTLVTHRVVSVNPVADGSAEEKAVVLKGDANASEDPVPYQVSQGQRVVATVPFIGSWVMTSRGPWFIGAATLILSALVTWGFWPRREPRHVADSRRSDAGSGS